VVVDAVDVMMVLEEIGSVTFSGNSSAVVHGDDGLEARWHLDRSGLKAKPFAQEPKNWTSLAPSLMQLRKIRQFPNIYDK